MSTYQLEIDGSGAESGAERIVRSFDSIKAAADRMEGGVVAAARKASASFGDLQKNAKPVSSQAIDSLRQLSAVFKGFRGPSDAAVRNTIIFLQGLKSVGTLNLGRVSGLAALTAAIASFKGPSPGAGKNTESLINALRRATGFTAPRGLSTVLTALAGFRGPTAAGARNVRALMNALSSFTAPRGLAAAARALDAITAAANRARGSLGSLRGMSVGKTNITVNTRDAENNVGRLIKQQGLLQGALLRTQTMWNSLGGILAGKLIIGAANDMIKIRAQLEAATGSAAQGRVQFLYLKEAAQNLGLEMVSLSRSYGFFLGSIKGTGLSFADAQKIFTGFTTAARGLQLSTSDMDGIFRALGQIMSKGKLQAEELRQQLGDRLPGAFIRFARALDMTKPGELDAALKKGTISGKKLQDALVKLAESLRVEFAGAAEKMTHTVDAAFNRLRNAFTFSADTLGRSGMNEALIEILDTLTKFVKSDALNNGLKVVAALFKFLGNHIEAVANIIGVLALNATLKWVSGLTLLSKAGNLVTAFMSTGSLTAVQMAAGMGNIAKSTTLATRATAIFSAVLRANPLFWFAAVIMGVVWAYNKLTDTMTDQKSAMNELNGKMADAENFFDAIIEKQINLAATTGDTTNEIYKQIHAMHQLALEGSAQNVEGYAPTYTLGGLLTGKPAGIAGPSGQLSADDAKFISQYFYKSGNGYKLKNLSGGALTPDRKGFGQLATVGGILQARIKGRNPTNPENDPLYGFLNTTRGRFNALKSQSEEPNYKGNPYAAWAGQVAGDYNHSATEPGLSGAMVGTNKKHGKSEAEKWADELERNLRQAEKAMTDLGVEATATMDKIDGLLSGSLDSVAATAQAAAQSQLKTFEDAFDSAEKAQAGTQALAQQLQGAGKIAADADISGYDNARAAVLQYMTALQDLAARREKAADVAQEVASMRETNDVNEEAITRLQDLGRTMSDVNKSREISEKLIGINNDTVVVTIDGVKQEIGMRDLLYKILGKEIDRREELRRAEDDANKARELDIMQKVNQEMRPLQAQGLPEADLSYYREMFETRQKLIHDGYHGKELRDRIATEAAILNEARAQDKLNDELEKGRQFAADIADALVGGFRDAMKSGGDFLQSFKDMFKNIKNIILDFVLYNPLKQFLTNALQGATVAGNSQLGTKTSMGSPGGGAMGAVVTGGASIAGSIATAMTAIAGSASAAGGGTGIGPNGQWSYDADGFLVPSGRDIVVTGSRNSLPDTNAPIPPPQAQQAGNYFKQFAKIFDFKANGTALKNFGSFLKGGKLDAAGNPMTASSAIGGALGAAGNALAAYQMGSSLGKGFAKMLGGGFRAQAVAGGVAGGAAAGFSLGGPIGAAIGAVAGGILGFMKKKPKIPSSMGSITVSSTGRAEVGGSTGYGGGSAEAGRAMAQAGADMFNRFAYDLDAYLTPGNFGTFGKRKFKMPGPDQEMSFYSLTGNTSKGKPTGVEGVDWIKGTDSQVQAFALIQQVRRGMITGLSDTLKTVFQNTKATEMDALNADIDTGKAYDAFVKGSFRLTDTAKQVRDLNEAFNQLSRRAKDLGLNETKLLHARDRMMEQLKDEFNFTVQQGILGLTNPAMQAYNDLVREYRDTVEAAMAVGGDLSAVEDFYGRRRAELAEQWADIATNGLVSASKELYESLTASNSSPLASGTIFRNAADLFHGLQQEFASGDYSHVSNLSGYATNYLDAARSMYGSSSSYFDIFQEVTDFLAQMSGIAGEGAGGGGVGEPPSLPDLDAIVAEINAQSLEMIDELSLVGGAVVEGSTSIVDAINNLAIALGYRPPGATTNPTTPGGTTSPGDGSVGTVGGGGGRFGGRSTVRLV